MEPIINYLTTTLAGPKPYFERIDTHSLTRNVKLCPLKRNPRKICLNLDFKPLLRNSLITYRPLSSSFLGFPL